MKNKRTYDFAGWVTKSDIKCEDGVVIQQGAFEAMDGKTVPLVWNHGHDDPRNILGSMLLENREEGMYGYGYFNEGETAQHASKLVDNEDIGMMSIYANKLEKKGDRVTHGIIREVSLVLAGANPGAVIEEFVAHSDTGNAVSGAFISGLEFLMHSADDVPADEKADEGLEKGKKKDDTSDPTVEDVIETMDEDQRLLFDTVLAQLNEAQDAMEDADEQKILQQTILNNGGTKMAKQQDIWDLGNKTDKKEENAVLVHAAINDKLVEAAKSGGTLRSVLDSVKADDKLMHGIENISKLFDEGQYINSGQAILNNIPTLAEEIVNGCRKVPFSKLKSRHIDISEEEARANGYITGDEKIEQFIKVLGRETHPQTVYVKQKLDRDNILDITTMDIVSMLKDEMKVKLKEEIARAILVGDGREDSSKQKIKADNIRPIFFDDAFYTISKTIENNKLVDGIILAKKEYRGSGTPTLYINPTNLGDLLILKNRLGDYMFKDVNELATRLGVASIKETILISSDKALIVNLADYTIGASKGGEITDFEDFDIDYNTYKYLTETRASGALDVPKSAIAINIIPAEEVTDVVIPGDKAGAKGGSANTTPNQG